MEESVRIAMGSSQSSSEEMDPGARFAAGQPPLCKEGKTETDEIMKALEEYTRLEWQK